MKALLDTARRMRNRLFHKNRDARFDADYAAKLATETANYKDVENVHDLPDIFHYWSNTHIRPMFEQYGFSNPDQFFAKYLRESAQACGSGSARFVSVGSGNCDTEVRVAKMLLEKGFSDFTIECVDMNPHMLGRGAELASAEGVADRIVTTKADFNSWKPGHRYDGVMANQSLHHVVNLEKLFDTIRGCLKERAYFITSDIIGRNGHMRWPEALIQVNELWRELPERYHYNHQLRRMEPEYENWDCSKEGFEGIRAQDVLPELLKRFNFRFFVGFGNVVDIFVDRSFGHNFDANDPHDRAFIDRAHAIDEAGFQTGSLSPTHVMAVMSLSEVDCIAARGVTPQRSVHA